jgi:hypothetical protein
LKRDFWDYFGNIGRHKMKKVSFFLSFALMLLLAVCGVKADIWYSQNFDNLSDGDVAGQDGWEKTTDLTADIGSLTVQGAVFNGNSGKALKAEAMQEVRRSFDPIHTGTQFLIISFRKEDAGPDNTLHIYMGKDVHEWPAGPVLRIGKDSGGDPDKVGAHDGADRKQIATFVPGQWYQVRIVVHYDQLNYDVYFDGALVAQGFKFRTNTHDGLGWLMIGFDAGVGVIGYYDDIVMGDGDGSDYNPSAVSPEKKLAVTWGKLKL